MQITQILNSGWPLEVSLSRIGLALALGFLIGLERERAGKDVGVRTFSFTSLLGALGWMTAPTVGLATLGFVVLMTLIINIQSLLRDKSTVITTSVTLFLTGLIGILVGAGETLVPTAATLFIVALLSWKEALVSFSLGLSRLEVRSAITLGILAFVIYPLLPTGFIDPWHIIDLRSTWLTVIMISAIGFGNYILLRLYGAKGVAYTGFLGGLVSSVVTVTELAATVRRSGSSMRNYALRGMRLANMAMLLRNGLVLSLVAPASLFYPLLPITSMLLVSGLLALPKFQLSSLPGKQTTEYYRSSRLNYYISHSPIRRRHWANPPVTEGQKVTSTATAIKETEESYCPIELKDREFKAKSAKVENEEMDKPPSLTLSSPFSLKSALKYGLIFLAITILGNLGQRLAGAVGFYLVSFIGGLVSSASASATAATLAVQGKVPVAEAGIAALLASCASALMQLIMADRVSGDRKLAHRLLLENVLVFGAGTIVMVVQIGLEVAGVFDPSAFLQLFS
ncbi:MAG TPA: DUF4010 domain-containing protein [Chloroflexia bacterium]|nr:DUF4010 domain-containing protein [Chloroflexia bacterium]